MLTNFQTFCTVEKHMKFATKPYDITHLTLGMLLHYLGKLKMQIFCIYSAHIKEIFIASTFVIHLQISIFSVSKIARFTCTDCKYNFPCHCSFTCLLLRWICGNGNSSQQTSLQCLSTVNVVFFSDEDKIFIKHIDTFRIHSYTRRGIKMVHLKCNLFAFSSICAEYLQKIWFSISQGSVATCLR